MSQWQKAFEILGIVLFITIVYFLCRDGINTEEVAITVLSVPLSGIAVGIASLFLGESMTNLNAFLIFLLTFIYAKEIYLYVLGAAIIIAVIWLIIVIQFCVKRHRKAKLREEINRRDYLAEQQ